MPRAYPSLDELLADPDVDVVHVTSPNHLHVPQARAILAAGRHVVCEKPLAMTSAESAELVDLAAASGLVNAVNFNIRFYPLNQHVRRASSPRAALGDVRLVTGHYFQDWLLLDTDWNWRLEPDKGGALRAVGDIGSHWLDLMTFLTGQPIVSVMADLATFIPRAVPAARAGRDLLDRAQQRHGRARDDDRGRRLHPAPLRERRPRLRGGLADQRRAQELAPVGDRRLHRIGGLGLGDARPPLARPPRPAERAPAPQPRADGRARGAPRPRCPAATSRASPTRSGRSSGRSTPTSSPAGRPSARPTRPSPTATTRCSSATRSPRAPDSAAGSTSPGRRPRSPPAASRDRVPAPGPRPQRGVAMRLGLLTAPFPSTPLVEVADWAAANGFEGIEIACWPRASGPTRRYAGTSHIDVANLSGGAGHRARRRDRREGPDDLGPRLLPQPAPPGSARTGPRSSATSGT